jgi:hypothetical protein
VTADGYGTVPLFEPPVPPPLQPARTRPPRSPLTAAWTPVSDTTAELPCDDCTALHAEQPAAPLARRAKWRRTEAADRRYLCDGHADMWRTTEPGQ